MPSTACAALPPSASSPCTCGCSRCRAPTAADELVSLLTGELRLGVVLFFVLSGYLLARAVGRERPGRAPDAAPGALRGQARGAHRSRLLGRDARLLLAAERDRARLRGQRGPAAALRRLRAELRRRRRRQARPADVVAGRRGELLRGAPARRVAARARGAARADGGGLRRAGRPSAWRWSAAGALLAWPDTAMSTLPTFLPVFACGMAAAALAHRRAPSRAAWWALLVAGAALVAADAWWHHQGTGMTGHVVRDLPAALGFARRGGRRGGASAGGPVVRAPARPGHDLLRPVPVAPAGAAVAALRGPAAAAASSARGSRSRRSACWWRSRAGCSSSGP